MISFFSLFLNALESAQGTSGPACAGSPESRSPAGAPAARNAESAAPATAFFTPSSRGAAAFLATVRTAPVRALAPPLTDAEEEFIFSAAILTTPEPVPLTTSPSLRDLDFLFS